jgi:hypothetical protein
LDALLQPDAKNNLKMEQNAQFVWMVTDLKLLELALPVLEVLLFVILLPMLKLSFLAIMV